MLPSIRHLLDTDPAAGRSNNSTIPSLPTASMPAPAQHPLKTAGQKQTDAMTVDGPYQQGNISKYNEPQYHPPLPYGLTQSGYPHRQSIHEQGNAREPIPIPPTSASGPIAQSSQRPRSTHYSHHNGYPKDYEPHYMPSAPMDADPLSSDADPMRRSNRSISPHASPRSAYHSDSSSDPRRDPRTAGGSSGAPTWPPRLNVLSQISPPQPQSTSSSSYRSQQRTSPFDPSVSSSSSSASPSPSISTATAASAPMTADAIAAVTKGTAAASISDSRSRYGSNTVGLRIPMRGENKEPFSDRHSLVAEHPERMDRLYNNNSNNNNNNNNNNNSNNNINNNNNHIHNNDASMSPHEGFVQSFAARNPASSSPPLGRGVNPDALMGHRHQPHHSPPTYADEQAAKRRPSRVTLQGGHDLRYERNSGPDDAPSGYGSNGHRPPIPEPVGDERWYQSHPPSSSSGAYLAHTAAPSTSPSRSFYSAHHPYHRPSITSSHSSLPSSPTTRPAGAPQEMFDHKERDMDHNWPAEHRRPDPQHVDSGLGPGHVNGHGHGRRYESLSSPGLSGSHSVQSPVTSSFSSRPVMTPHSPHSPHSPHPPASHHQQHQQFHPSLQQQQHPPPLYDPVRESDHRTLQHPVTSISQAPLPIHPLSIPHQQHRLHQAPPPGSEHDRPAQRQRYATTNPTPTSAPSETQPLSSRHHGLQQQGLTSRSDRVSPPESSHPYYTPSHALSPSSRSFNNGPASDTDLRYSRMKEEEYERASSRGSTLHGQGHPSLLPQSQPSPSVNSSGAFHTSSSMSSLSSSSQARYPNEGGMHGHGWHSSHGYPPADRPSAEAGHHDRHHSNSEGTMDRRREKLGGHWDDDKDRYSVSQSDEVSSFQQQQWRDSRRSIRLSVSESDLQATEMLQHQHQQQQQLGRQDGYLQARKEEDQKEVEEGDDANEEDEDLELEGDEIDDIEEGDDGGYEIEEDGENTKDGRALPRRQYSQHQHPHQQQHQHQHQQQQQQQHRHQQQQQQQQQQQEGYRHENERYDARLGRENMSDSGQHGFPPHPHSSHHSHAHSFDGGSIQQQHVPEHSRSHSQSFASSASPYSSRPHQQHGHQPPYPGQYQQQPSSQQTASQQQHPMMGQYPSDHHGPPSSSLTSSHSSSPRVPNRRGPYLSRQRALLAGLETTTASSRYQCNFCNKRFSRPSSLRIHTYSHTGERPFKCSEEGCGRQFSVQSNMRRHLRVHRMGRMRSEFPVRD